MRDGYSRQSVEIARRSIQNHEGIDTGVSTLTIAINEEPLKVQEYGLAIVTEQKLYKSGTLDLGVLFI